MAVRPDSVIITAIIAEIESQLITFGLSSGDVLVTRAKQQTTQFAEGTESSARYQVMLSQVSYGNIGTAGYTSDDVGNEAYQSIAGYEYQVSCLAEPITSADDDGLNAFDLCNLVHDLLLQYDALESLAESGVNLENCGEMRPIFQTNQDGQLEQMPSFDIALNFTNTYTKATPAITDITGIIKGV